MAREHARVKLSIWEDDDFRQLSPAAQHLYFVLMTHNALDYCGVTDWRPPRLAQFAGGWTTQAVEIAAQELSEARYVVIDTDSEEVLLRSFIRNDELLESPNMAVAMRKAHAAVASSALRAIVVHELVRLHNDKPELKGWPKVSDLLGKTSLDPSEYPTFTPSLNPSGNPSGKGLAKGSGSPSPTTAPSPTPATAPAPRQVSEDLGVDRYETLRAIPAIPATQPPRCSKHKNGNPDDEDCRGCQRERTWNDEQDRKQREALAELARNCVLCEGGHFVLDADKRPTRKKCTDHRRSA